MIERDNLTDIHYFYFLVGEHFYRNNLNNLNNLNDLNVQLDLSRYNDNELNIFKYVLGRHLMNRF